MNDYVRSQDNVLNCTIYECTYMYVEYFLFNGIINNSVSELKEQILETTLCASNASRDNVALNSDAIVARNSSAYARAYNEEKSSQMCYVDEPNPSIFQLGLG